VPGETWPNRNFLHAATSDGETDIEIRGYTNPTIFELLERNNADWRIYFDDTPQVWAFPALWDRADRHRNWYLSEKFAEHVAANNLPEYSFIEPNHHPPLHFLDHNPNGGPEASDSQHPENNLVSNTAYDTFNAATDTDFARGESLIATIYEALRANPELFARTMLVITYDEHGGLYDHVPPPTGVSASDDGRGPGGSVLYVIWHRKAKSFDFTMLGPRIPAVIVSPLIEAGTIDHRVHDHASVPATLRALFAPRAKPLTRWDAWATPFHNLASRDTPRTDLPDLSAYRREAPAPALAATAEAVAATTAAPDTSPDAVIPDYYQEFLKQADAVRQHLTQVGEPEIAAVTARGQLQRAAQTSQAFQQAAHRHRHPG